MKMKKKKEKKLREETLTYQEWQDALRVPGPVKSKKGYKRKPKHKDDYLSDLDQF